MKITFVVAVILIILLITAIVLRNVKQVAVNSVQKDQEKYPGTSSRKSLYQMLEENAQLGSGIINKYLKGEIRHSKFVTIAESSIKNFNDCVANDIAWRELSKDLFPVNTAFDSSLASI